MQYAQHNGRLGPFPGPVSLGEMPRGTCQGLRRGRIGPELPPGRQGQCHGPARGRRPLRERLDARRARIGHRLAGRRPMVLSPCALPPGSAPCRLHDRAGLSRPSRPTSRARRTAPFGRGPAAPGGPARGSCELDTCRSGQSLSIHRDRPAGRHRIRPRLGDDRGQALPHRVRLRGGDVRLRQRRPARPLLRDHDVPAAGKGRTAAPIDSTGISAAIGSRT